MLNVRATLLVVLLTPLVGCVNSQRESVEVYQAVFAHIREAPGIFYIRESFASPDASSLSQENLNIYSSYKFESRENRHTAKDFESLPIHLMSELEQQEIFKNGCESGWRRFHRKYPNAKSLIGVSLVGFRSYYSEALVYISGASDCLAGSGHFIKLEKKNGIWSVTQEYSLWVA